MPECTRYSDDPSLSLFQPVGHTIVCHLRSKPSCPKCTLRPPHRYQIPYPEISFPFCCMCLSRKQSTGHGPRGNTTPSVPASVHAPTRRAKSASVSMRGRLPTHTCACALASATLVVRITDGYYMVTTHLCTHSTHTHTEHRTTRPSSSP